MADKPDNKLLRDPDVAPTSRRPLAFILAGVSVLLLTFGGVLLFNSSEDSVKREGTIKVERPQKKELASGGDRAGIISEFFPEENKTRRNGNDSEAVQTTGVIEAKPVKPTNTDDVRVVTVRFPQRPETPVVGATTKTKVNPEVNPENEEIKRMRSAAFYRAVAAPMTTGTQTQATPSASVNTTTAGRLDTDALTAHLRGTGLVAGSATSTTPEQGMSGENIASREEWALKRERTAGANYELKTGSVIHGVLISGINSDLAGAITAQTSQNVYDSTTGQYLLIPAGSKLYGTYANSVAFGQESLFVAWQRIIFPDGSSITLSGEDAGMGGNRLSGQSGFSDRVNNHYFKIFGSAILMSMISAASSYVLDDDSSSNKDASNINTSATNSLAQQLGQTSMSLLQKNLSIAPTLEIRSGYRFLITVTKDISFDAPYYRMAKR
ncbi:hypothetical protein LJB93_02015 [Desulfovibrio sp. OttesenSCG-928-F07]|nr:hypothetical protein [Desulfovibrio sp. OttesenSCG-928-F07]